MRCDTGTRLLDEHHFGIAEIGRQVGGWLTRESDVIYRLEQTAGSLRRQAVTLQQYLATTFRSVSGSTVSACHRCEDAVISG